MSWDDSFARFRKRLGAKHPPSHRHEVPFKVPEYLKDVKPSEYDPHTVSLGLNPRLEPGLEYYKADFQRCFLRWKTKHASSMLDQRPRTENRTSAGLNSSSAVVYTWDHFIEDLKLDTDVQTANRWYEIDTSPVRPIILKNFLALDALFLVLFLRYSYQKVSCSRLPDDVFKELEKESVYKLLAEARSGIWRDVFLLENQIPLHILEKVWILMPDMEGRPQEEASALFNKQLREVVKGRYLELFDCSSGDGEQFVSMVLSDKLFLECDHLLDCLHYAVCYSPPPQDDKLEHAVDEKAFVPANSIPSATQLRKVGIRLNSEGCNFIYQIKFESSFWGRPALHLPRLCVSDQTESLLRNLAVFEMVSCYQSPWPRVGPRLYTITSFLILMEKLIQTSGDVRLMRGEGIITNCLGSNREMSDMWTTLCKRFSLQLYQHSQWSEMLKKLMTRYKNRRHQLLAEFRDKYFARPWVVVSWVAAVLLLALTGLQTTYTLVTYYKPPLARQ